MDAGLELAREQIRELVEASEGTIELDHEHVSDDAATLTFLVTLPFQPIARARGGLPVHARERFQIVVRTGFPFISPSVWVLHSRFAGFPHVQWARYLCLYQSATDWQPASGVFGLVRRLDQWIRDAALNQLDPDDAPLHPPATYAKSERLVVPLANTPTVHAEPWLGLAVLRERGNRTEIVEWVEVDGGALPERFAVTFLLPQAFPFEYPSTIHDLTNELEKQGLSYGQLMRFLSTVARTTERGTPFLVVLGTPMRRVKPGGPLLQHLEVWEIGAEDADHLRDLKEFFGDDPETRELGEEAKNKVVKWSVEARVLWCDVKEHREEVTVRRDEESPVSWFRAQRVELWGCGAIGSHVAEFLSRAGVARLVLRDCGCVTPGLLVRQAFDDDDIGRPKASALAERVKRLNPLVRVDAHTGNLLSLLDGGDIFDGVDIVLDTTGSSAVRLKLERRVRGGGKKPVVASMAVSFDAQAGLATLSRPEHRGASADVTRRLKLAACLDRRLKAFREDFWPQEPRGRRFQPEPGCSEPTFRGSDADLAGLSARMLNALGAELRNGDPGRVCAGWLLHARGDERRVAWRDDVVLGTPGGRYEIRLSTGAVREMRAWIRRSHRLHGTSLETGGLLFGEVNEAAGVLWVTEAEGPPRDSSASSEHFTCGVEGMTEANAEKRKRTGGSVACIGSWHTHPESPARPSDVDFEAVRAMLADADTARRTCLLLILGTDLDERIRVGGYVFRTTVRSERVAIGALVASAEGEIASPASGPRNLGLACSGGGARAIAFHLGCLRALHDLGLLSRLQVLSGVSGGAVCAALFAYDSGSFADFEARVVERLRKGFVREILRELGRWRNLIPSSVSWIVRPIIGGLSRITGRMPPPRRFSRTEAFRTVLDRAFGGRRVHEVERSGLDVVITATDLRSGSAFRYGSRETGCWRYSRYARVAKEEVYVADAVAASAAYPVLLPALERDYTFDGHEGATTERVVLTDGGIFDNLGVSPLEPDRTDAFSTNVFRPEYVIACDAGPGLFDLDVYPLTWSGRVRRSFETTHRKAQDATRKRLHKLAESGDIEGFVLPYLGQVDEQLPWVPSDLPSRREVAGYPTDFSPMSDEALERLAARGERLTRLLVAHYWPDV